MNLFRLHRLAPLLLIALATAQAQSADTRLLPADPGEAHHFGASVAIDGDTAVVGAPDANNEKGVNAGAAYVFRRIDGAWSLQQTLLNPDASLTAGDRFGSSVAVAGDLVAVGARIDNASRGAVHVYERANADSPFAVSEKLLAADAASGDRFGLSVSLRRGSTATTLAVGAPFKDLAGAADAGVVYVYTRAHAALQFTQQARLSAGGSAAESDEFGRAIELSETGDRLVVGVPGDDDRGPGSGSAFVFVRSGNLWSQQAKLVSLNLAAGDGFGSAVTISGDSVLVGAPLANAGHGKSYVYTLTSGAWLQQAVLSAPWPGYHQFGGAVQLLGDYAVITGQQWPDSLTHPPVAFRRSGSTWSQAAPLNPGVNPNPNWRRAVLALDGETLMVGAPMQAAPVAEAGATHVFTVDPLRLFGNGFEPE